MNTGVPEDCSGGTARIYLVDLVDKAEQATHSKATYCDCMTSESEPAVLGGPPVLAYETITNSAGSAGGDPPVPPVPPVPPPTLPGSAALLPAMPLRPTALL